MWSSNSVFYGASSEPYPALHRKLTAMSYLFKDRPEQISLEVMTKKSLLLSYQDDEYQELLSIIKSYVYKI